MSSGKIILPPGMSVSSNEEPANPKGTENVDFLWKVKYVAPVEIKLVDFVSKEGNVQGPRKLVAFLPTGEAFVIVPDVQALETLSKEEINEMMAWEKMLQEKASFLGGNIIIDPATGEVKAAPMPPGMSSLLGDMARGGPPRKKMPH